MILPHRNQPRRIPLWQVLLAGAVYSGGVLLFGLLCLERLAR